MRDRGEVAEWSIAADSKSVVPLAVPGVRIPPSPPLLLFTEAISASLAGDTLTSKAVLRDLVNVSRALPRK
jgi:hypothetical protein